MSAYDFSADDVFKLAEEIEVNGADFYRNAAAKAPDKSKEQLLTGLADMEVEHRKMFGQMRAELKGMDTAQTVFDPEADAASYLKALADIRVFFDKEIDMSSMEEILKAAITAEKDSIVLYLGMKELVPAKFGKNRIETIIQEEMRHIRLLSRELKLLHS